MVYIYMVPVGQLLTLPKIRYNNFFVSDLKIVFLNNY